MVKLRFESATIDTPVSYAHFVFDLNQRMITDIYEACEAAGFERLVYDSLQDWVRDNPDLLATYPQDALVAVCRALAAPRPNGGPTKAQARDTALRATAVALCNRYDVTLHRNKAGTHVSAASILAEIARISEDRMDKVLKGALAQK